MSRSIPALVGLLLGLWSIAASAQIMFVGAADLGGNGSSTTSLAANYTTGGKSNEILEVCLFDVNATTDGSNETMTYNGVPMTYVASTQGLSNSGANWTTSQWYLLNPASGTNSVSYSRTIGAAASIQMLAVDYANVRQSGQPDNAGFSNDSGNNDTYSGTTTTATDLATVIGCAFNSGNTLTPSTSGAFTTRVTGANKDSLIADSGLVIPHGNVTFTATITNGAAPQQQGWVSILPTGSGLLLHGVGP